MSQAIPVSSSERIFLLDIIRGFALCGILILNIYFFGRPEPALFNLNVYGETGIGNVATWYITVFLVEGSYRALFSMLFGAGCILLVSRLEKNDNGLRPADIYYTRLLWLLIFGLINAFILLWPGDILYSYAICGLFIFPFRKSSVRVLLLMAALLVSITMFKASNKFNDRMSKEEKGKAALAIEAQHKKLTEKQQGELEAYKELHKKSEPKSIRKEADKETAVFQKPYIEIFKYVLPINKEIESSLFYDNYFFDVLIFVFLGMAFYKMGILTGEKPAWLYWLFVVVGYGIGLGMGIYTAHLWRIADYDFYEYVRIRPFRFDFYQLHRVLVALGHLGTIVLLYKSGWFKTLLKPFGYVGQMAFTNYLSQTIICSLFFYGYGFAYFGKLERYELWYVVLGVWIFQLITSTIWLQYFRFGPLEWAWRSLTYWKIQPFKRAATEDGAGAAV